MYQKFGSKIEFFGFENPTYKISEQSPEDERKHSF